MNHSLLLSFLIALTTSGLVSAQSTPKRFALLAGVNKYAERNFEGSPLKFAERDVEELAAELKEQGFDQVILLKGSASGKDRATSENILASLDQILKAASATDVVLVALTGHGNQVALKDEQGKPIEDADGKPKEDIFYHPVDAIKTSDLTYPRSISISQILDKLEADGGVNLVLLDACRDVPKDPTRRARLISGNDWKRTMPANTSILFACSGGQLAWESEKASGGHGIFFHTLLEGLRGGAASASQRVTWKSLETYVIENTNANAESLIGKDAKKPDQEELQTPHGIGNVNRNPILVDLKKRLAAEPAPFNFADRARTAEEARAAQEAWAKKLGVDVVETNSLGMQMVLIPPGEFMMGTSTEEANSYIKTWPETNSLFYVDEQPKHRVSIDKPFRIAAHEVTVAQFKVFVDSESYKTDAEKSPPDEGEHKGGRGFDAGTYKQDPKFNWRNNGVTTGSNYPVSNISHNDAIAFIAWLNRGVVKGKEYRLSSEAEWEYACRAGSTTTYYSGDDPKSLLEFANISSFQLRTSLGGDNAISGTGVPDKFPFLAPVGQFLPNGFGIFDMHGNVEEWLGEAYDRNAYKAAVEGKVDKIESTSHQFIARGGNYSSAMHQCRSADRSSWYPYYRNYGLGFRLAKAE